MITIEKALQSLRPNSQWVLRGDNLEWLDTEQTQPTDAEIAAEVTKLQSEYDAKEYARKRVKEYPSLADFVDAYYWAQNGDDTKMTAYIEKCAAVKDKYPKA
jgi:hypothetical protein